MQARVKEKSWISVVTAFGGREYVRYELRTVPVGYEAEAKQHPLLDVVLPEPIASPEPVKRAKVRK